MVGSSDVSSVEKRAAWMGSAWAVSKAVLWAVQRADSSVALTAVAKVAPMADWKAVSTAE
jgi:hypothetical protein